MSFIILSKVDSSVSDRSFKLPMPTPKEHDRGSQSPDNEKMVTAMCDQLVVDIPSLPAEIQQNLATLCDAETPCSDPAKAVADHLKTNPRRIRQLAVAVVDYLPFRECFAFFGIIRPPAVGNDLMQKLISVLGEARSMLYIVAINERAKVKDGIVPQWVVEGSTKFSVLPALTPDKWEPLAAELRSMSLVVDKVLKEEIVQRATKAEALCGKLETELSMEKASRKKHEERISKEHQRGKDAVKKTAETAANSKFGKEIADKDVTIARLQADYSKVQAALDESKKAVPQAGISQADLDALRKQMEKEYADRLETELFLKVRPWLDRLEEAEAGYQKANQALELSTQTLEMARKESAEKDLLLMWESEPEHALPKVSNALAEVDRLLALTASPSPALLQTHRQLREAIDGCRALIKSRTGKSNGTLMSNAIIAKIKSADYDQLGLIAASINHLAETKVLTDDEATIISKMINDEVALRTARQEHKTSTFALLNTDLHAGKEVDVLVDAYNFMHLAKQHFYKLARPVPGDPTKSIFDHEGRAKLALMASRIHAKFKQARVILFLDGQKCEKSRPHDGVQFKLPTIQKTGEGQADAEIIHYLSHGIRPKASIYVVSNDHQVRDTANRHLSVGLFSQLLDELG